MKKRKNGYENGDMKSMTLSLEKKKQCALVLIKGIDST
jgi:hypothetical protein